MPGTVLKTPFRLTHLILQEQYNVNIIIAILNIRELRHRKIKYLAKSYTAIKVALGHSRFFIIFGVLAGGDRSQV